MKGNILIQTHRKKERKNIKNHIQSFHYPKERFKSHTLIQISAKNGPFVLFYQYAKATLVEFIQLHNSVLAHISNNSVTNKKNCNF